MGKPDGTNQERRHRRIIRRPFYLAETETTVAQFRRFVDATGYTTDAERGAPEEPDKTIGAFAQIAEIHRRRWSAEAQWRNPFPELAEYKLVDDHPVVQVSWNDARAFCDHFGLDLPTEIQWEYACRAGATTRFPWGDDSAGFRGRDNGADASTRRLLTGETDFFTFDDGHPLLAPVRSFKPNAYAVFGMMGNVEEWCANGFSALIPTDGADETAPVPAPDDVRALRGGNWFSGTNGTPCADRFGMRPQSRRDFIGFRVCLEIPEE